MVSHKLYLHIVGIKSKPYKSKLNDKNPTKRKTIYDRWLYSSNSWEEELVILLSIQFYSSNP